MSDLELPFGEFDLDAEQFILVRLPLKVLEATRNRPLSLSSILANDMVHRGHTEGVIILDDDGSVIDGMHRIAATLALDEEEIDACVRYKNRWALEHAIEAINQMGSEVFYNPEFYSKLLLHTYQCECFAVHPGRRILKRPVP